MRGIQVTEVSGENQNQAKDSDITWIWENVPAAMEGEAAAAVVLCVALLKSMKLTGR